MENTSLNIFTFEINSRRRIADGGSLVRKLEAWNVASRPIGCARPGRVCFPASPFTPVAKCPLSKILILEIVRFPSPGPPHSTELRELSAVSRSSSSKVCAPRISMFGIHVRI